MKSSKRGFNKVRILTTASMLTALSVIIGIFCKNFLNFGTGLFRVTFENFPIILSGIMFGPWVGSLVGVASDILSYILSTQSFAISPVVTLGAALVGCASGFVSHYIIKKNGIARIVASVIAAHLIGSIIVKSAGLFVYYGWAIVWRIPLYVVIASLEIILICLIYKNKNFHRLLNREEKDELQ